MLQVQNLRCTLHFSAAALPPLEPSPVKASPVPRFWVSKLEPYGKHFSPRMCAHLRLCLPQKWLAIVAAIVGPLFPQSDHSALLPFRWPQSDHLTGTSCRNQPWPIIWPFVRQCAHLCPTPRENFTSQRTFIGQSIALEAGLLAQCFCQFFHCALRVGTAATGPLGSTLAFVPYELGEKEVRPCFHLPRSLKEKI